MSSKKDIEFGRSKPASEFFKAFTKAADSRFLSNREDKTRNLVRGAIIAFQEGRPENFQTLLQNYKAIKFRSHSDNYPLSYVVWQLDDLVDKSTDKKADIERALAKTSAADKQAVLDQTLNYAVWRRYTDNNDTISALLACGADPNGKTNSRAGSILAGAAYCKSPDIVKTLYEHGANFETAIAYMRDDKDARERVKFYQRTLTGASAGEQLEAAADKVAHLEQKIDDLTAVVRELTEELRGQEPAAPPEKPARKPYPSL